MAGTGTARGSAYGPRQLAEQRFGLGPVQRSVDGGGAPKYVLGRRRRSRSCSKTVLDVVFPAGAGSDKSAWLTDTGDVYFATSGTKTLRVQTREDGVNIDQIVLSPSKFLNSSPGSLRDDTTLVNRAGTTSVIGTTSFEHVISPDAVVYGIDGQQYAGAELSAGSVHGWGEPLDGEGGGKPEPGEALSGRRSDYGQYRCDRSGATVGIGTWPP